MSIQRMKNQEIETNLKKLVSQERELLHEILLHIQQVEVRRIYLDRAYASTYEYLVKELSYSGSAAMRRIEAARLLKQIPSLSEQIESGGVNLSQIGELSRALKEKEKGSGQKVSLLQKKDIIANIAGKSVSETQKEIALALDLALKEPEKARFQKDDSVLLSLHLTKEQYEIFMQCKDLSAHVRDHKNQDHSWASVLEVLMQSYLKHKGSKEQRSDLPIAEQGRERNQNDNNKMSSLKTAHPSHSIAAAVSQSVGKTLTPKKRKFILNRDQCCQYIDKQSGRQCQSTYQLEVDHKTPRFASGDHDLQNLQILCKQHNVHKYRRQAKMRFL